MLTIHHLDDSQSFRIVWLLEEIQMPYELKIYQRTKDKLAPPEYKNLSPLGTSPTISDGDLILSESNAIIDYILDKAEAMQTSSSTLSLRPAPGSPHRVDYLFWFHMSAATFQAVMSMDSLLRVLPSKVPWPISLILQTVASKVQDAYFRPRLDKIYQLAEQHLATHMFLAGDQLTAADITIVYSFDSSLQRMPDLATTYPRCHAWYQRLLQRPALIKALEKVQQTHISFSDF